MPTPRPVAAIASRWLSDPDIATAYASLRPGGTPADRRRLAGPIHPGLRLAGEALSVEYPGTMHGAWFSGVDAARAVLEEVARPWAGTPYVVIGAGMAGIATARALRDAGAAVVVLEAGEAPGGRAGADRRLGVPVHLGAAWIHGTDGNPIADAARAAGVGWSPSAWDRTRAVVAGRGVLDGADRERVWALRHRVGERIHATAARAPIDLAVGPVARAAIDDVLRDQAVDAWERRLVESSVRSEFENLYGTPMDEMGLRYAAEPFSMPGPDVALTGPLDAVVTHLCRGLDVRTGTRATAVRRDGHRWIVDTVDRDGAQASVEAVGAVVTTPIGALQAGRVAFEPDLPADAIDALARFHPGSLAKVCVRFDAPFDVGGAAFWTIGEGRLPVELWLDVSTLAGAPVLSGFASGHGAPDVENMSSDDLGALAADALALFEG